MFSPTASETRSAADSNDTMMTLLAEGDERTTDLRVGSTHLSRRTPSSLQPFVFLLRLDQDRQVRVRRFPEREEILILLARLRGITLYRQRARQI
jgi:hypothetical protein